MRFVCSQCKTIQDVSGHAMGKWVVCHECGHKQQVVASDESVTVAPRSAGGAESVCGSCSYRGTMKATYPAWVVFFLGAGRGRKCPHCGKRQK